MGLATLLLLVLLALAGQCRGWGFSPAPAAPRFAVVPANSYKAGRADQVEVLSSEAEKEGFLDRVLGSNCFTVAVQELKADCRRMTQEQKSRLALDLVNCHQAAHGGQTYPCGRRQTLKQCTEALPDRMWTLYVEFLSHADSMCLFIQNQQFEKYTENMLNRLSAGALFAREQLATISGATEALGKDTAALQARAGEALELLQQQQELGQAALEATHKARAEAAAYFESLDSKQDRGLELADQSLAKAQALAEGQEAAAAALTAGQEQVAALFGMIDERSAALAAAQAEHTAAQRAMTSELKSLADDSRGLRSAVDVVLTYQQRSDAVLIRLLGKSYSLEDAAFYLGGVLAAAAAGVSPATAPARTPIAALLGLSLVGERLLLDRLSFWLEVSQEGDRVVLPLGRWLPFLPAGAAGAVDLRWGVRRLVAALAVGVLVYYLAVHRNFEKESYRLLQRLEEDSRRRHAQYVELVKQQRLEFLSALSAKAYSSKPTGSRQQHQQQGPKQNSKAEAAAGWDLMLPGQAADGPEALPARHATSLLQLMPAGHAAEGRQGLMPAGDHAHGGSSEEDEGYTAAPVQVARRKQAPAAQRAAAATPAAPLSRGAAAAAAKASRPAISPAHAVCTPQSRQRTASATAEPVATRTRKRTASSETELTAATIGGTKRRGSGQTTRVTSLEVVMEEAGDMQAAGQQPQRSKRGLKPAGAEAEPSGGKRARKA